MDFTEIFISHAAKDADLAGALVRCIEGALEVPSGAIRCTSVPGYKLDVGANANETLRENIERSKIVIGILTEQSLLSGFVIMELGAAWGLQKVTCPVLDSGVDFKRIPGPLGATHAIRLDNSPDVAQLMDVIHRHTKFPERNRARAADAIDALVKNAIARPH